MLKSSVKNLISVRTSLGVRKCFLSTAAIEYPQLEALIRPYSETGSRQSRYLRKDATLPGVLYGSDNDFNVMKHTIKISQKDVMRELRIRGPSFENTVYNLTVKKELDELNEDNTPKTEVVVQYLVTPRQTHFSPVTEFPISVNFLRYRPGNRVRIPVIYKNMDQSQDMKRGCFLVHVNQFIECVCDDVVPASIIVDLAEAKKGDVYRLTPTLLPPRVRPSKYVSADYVLGVVQSSRG